MSAVTHSALALTIAAVLGAAGTAGAQPRTTVTTSASGATTVQVAPAAEPGTTVKPVTVNPQAAQQGRVVSSTNAPPLSSPDFTAEDAQAPPKAISLGGTAAAGSQKVAPRPPPGGLPASIDPGPARSDVGVTKVF